METLVANILKDLAYALFMVTFGFAFIAHRTAKRSDTNDGCARATMTIIGLGIGGILLMPAIRLGTAGIPAAVANVF